MILLYAAYGYTLLLRKYRTKFLKEKKNIQNIKAYLGKKKKKKKYKGLSAFYFFSYIYSARLKSHVIVLCEEILLWHFSPSEISIQQVSDVSMQVPVHRSKHVLVDTLLTGACVFAQIYPLRINIVKNSNWGLFNPK